MSSIPGFLTPLAAFNQQANQITSAVSGQSPQQVGLNRTADANSTPDSGSTEKPMSSNAAANQLRDSLLGNVDKLIDEKAKDLDLDLSSDMTRVEKVAAILSELGADSKDAESFKKDLATALGPLGKTINLGIADLGKFATDQSTSSTGYQADTLKEAARLITADTAHWAGAKDINNGGSRDSAPLRNLQTPTSTIAANPNARAA
jgi:hypothetical protein